MLPIDPFTELVVTFLANLVGALIGVVVGFRLERRSARDERERQYGRVLQSCKVELTFLRSFVQTDLTKLKAKSPLGFPLSASIAATRGALVNPLYFDHAPTPLTTVLTSVSEYSKINEQALAGWDKYQWALTKLTATAPPPQDPEPLRTNLVTSLTRFQHLIGVALETLDKELQRLGLAGQHDPADDAMRQRIHMILNEPPPQP